MSYLHCSRCFGTWISREFMRSTYSAYLILLWQKKTVFFLINFYGSIRPSNHSVRYPPCEAVPILYAWTRSNCKSCAKICAKIYGKIISRKYYTYQVPAIDFDNTNDTQMKAGRLRAMNQSKYFLIWIKMYFIRIKFDTTQFP